MRTLKDGTVKYKASAYKESQRLSGNPFPIRIYPVGTKVKIYMGAGWNAAYVVLSKQITALLGWLSAAGCLQSKTIAAFNHSRTDMSRALQIVEVCDEIKQLLVMKNKAYGDSAMTPVRVFSKANPVDQILVRIDDKLSRIAKGAGLLATDEDVVDDLIGYLVLLKIALRENKAELESYTSGDKFS